MAAHICNSSTLITDTLSGLCGNLHAHGATYIHPDKHIYTYKSMFKKVKQFLISGSGSKILESEVFWFAAGDKTQYLANTRPVL